MDNVNKLTKEDHQRISRIVKRAASVCEVGAHFSRVLDIESTLNSESIKKLEGFDDAEFIHDVIGIANHLNRDTLELEDFFVPRCLCEGGSA